MLTFRLVFEGVESEPVVCDYKLREEKKCENRVKVILFSIYSKYSLVKYETNFQTYLFHNIYYPRHDDTQNFLSCLA